MKRVLLSLTCLGVLSMSASGDLVPAQIVGGTLNEGYEYYGWDYDDFWYNEYQLTDYPQGHSADYSSWTVTDDSLSFSTSYYDWSYDTMGPDGTPMAMPRKTTGGFSPPRSSPPTAHWCPAGAMLCTKCLMPAAT